jgi:hypothetical protein
MALGKFLASQLTTPSTDKPTGRQWFFVRKQYQSRTDYRVRDSQLGVTRPARRNVSSYTRTLDRRALGEWRDEKDSLCTKNKCVTTVTGVYMSKEADKCSAERESTRAAEWDRDRSNKSETSMT